MKRLLTPRILCTVLTCLPLLAPATSNAPGTPGTLARNTALQSAPRDDASAVRQLDQGAPVTVLVRNDAWYRVEAKGQQGWVRLYWVRTGGARVQRAAGAPLKGISETLALTQQRQARGQVRAIIGVRGLSDEVLTGAHYNPAQLRVLDTLTVPNSDAAAFAAAAPVHARNVDELGASTSTRR